MFVRHALLPLLAVIGLLTRAFAASPHREAVTFTYTGDVGFGNSVFVVGDHPDVGGGDVTRALRLRYTAGNVWTGLIAVQAGTVLSYRFLSRATATDRWGDPANAVNLTGALSRTTPAQPAAPYRGKTVLYLSSWPRANLFYRSGAGWTETPMTRVGSGRVAGEAFVETGQRRRGGRVAGVRLPRREHRLGQPAGRGKLPHRQRRVSTSRTATSSPTRRPRSSPPRGSRPSG